MRSLTDGSLYKIAHHASPQSNGGKMSWKNWLSELLAINSADKFGPDHTDACYSDRERARRDWQQHALADAT
jgi:hypothetical protein